MIRVVLGQGVFPDIAKAEGEIGFWVTWQAGDEVLVARFVGIAGTVVHRYPCRENATERGLAFPRVSPTGRVAYRGPGAVLYADGVQIGNVPIGGNCPILVTEENIYAQLVPTNDVHRYSWSGEHRGFVRAGAPTGLSRVVGNSVATIDEDRMVVPGMLKPVWAGDAVIGEHPDKGIVVQRTVNEQMYRAVVDHTGITNDPRAIPVGDHWMVVAWTPYRIGPNQWDSDVILYEVQPLDLEPVEDAPEQSMPVGTVVNNVRDYIIGVPEAWPRTGTHPMHCVVKDRSAYFLKFANEDTPDYPNWERWGWDEDWIYHLEDRSGGKGSYSWVDGRWIPRTWSVGDSFVVETEQIDWDEQGNEVRRTPFKMRITFQAFVKNMRWGGSVGIADTLVVRYDPRIGQKPRPDGTLPGDYEVNFFAFGHGWVKWTSWKSRLAAEGGTDYQTHESIFNVKGGGRPTPSAGAIPAEWWIVEEPPVEDPPPVEKPPVKDPVTYEQFLHEADEVDAALKDAMGHAPSAADLYHNAWRRLSSERWSHRNIVQAIYTERGKEPPTPPEPPPSEHRRIVGQLRTAHGGFTDDNGPLNPCFCHFMEAFSAFVRRPDEVRHQLAAIAEAGYHGIRFLDILGFYDSYWIGREVTPYTFTAHSGATIHATQNYYAQLEEFLVACGAAGLAVHHSRGDLNGLTPSQLFEHADRVARIYSDIGHHVCALAEGNNEDWQNGALGPVNLRRMVLPFRERHILTGSSCPPGASEERTDLLEYRVGVDVSIVHGYRGGHWWDKARHCFSLGYEGKVFEIWQGEPTGPGNDVSATENRSELEDPVWGPARLCAMALNAALAKQAWTYMSGFGVRWNGPIESQPGFRDVPAALRLLPEDLATFSRLIHGGATWQHERVFAAWGDVRCDHAFHEDGRFVCLIYGPDDVRGAEPLRGEIETNHILSEEVRLVTGRV
jgi:hypothetical protein